MKIRIYATDSYGSWEEAEASGAVYERKLNVPPDMPMDVLKELLGEIVGVTEDCLAGGPIICTQLID